MKINRKQTERATTKIRGSKKPAAAARPVEQRKLAVVMFTDMVDYSALRHKNEILAFRLLVAER